MHISSAKTVASLGWVSLGAATEGVTPIFAHHRHFIDISLVCHPHGGCHPAPFLPARPRLSTILYKFAHNNFFLRVSPLEGVTRGGPPPPLPLVTPLYEKIKNGICTRHPFL